MTYRTPGETIPDIAVGPATACAACGARAIDNMVQIERVGAANFNATVGRHPKSPLPMPRACVPARRVWIGWFRRCKQDGKHLHERCRECGYEWTTAFVGTA